MTITELKKYIEFKEKEVKQVQKELELAKKDLKSKEK